MSFALQGVREVLCIGAHSDDIEIGCGGALLRLIAEQPDLIVHWVVFSGNDARHAEAARSAAAFLVGAAQSNVILRSFRDAYFPYEGAAVKECMQELALKISPDVVFTHRHEDAHQDHRLLADLTRNAFRSQPILQYEIPKYEGDLGQPNVYFPIDETICRRKVELLMDCFATQRDKNWFTEETFWALLRLRGLEAKSRFAEAFHCDKMVV